MGRWRPPWWESRAWGGKQSRPGSWAPPGAPGWEASPGTWARAPPRSSPPSPWTRTPWPHSRMRGWWLALPLRVVPLPLWCLLYRRFLMTHGVHFFLRLLVPPVFCSLLSMVGFLFLPFPLITTHFPVCTHNIHSLSDSAQLFLIFVTMLLQQALFRFDNTLLPRHITVQYNTILDTTWCLLGPRIIFKGLADIRYSSTFAHIAIETTGFI